MYYHVPGVIKSTSFITFLTILVSMATVFIFKNSGEKHIFVHIFTSLNDKKTNNHGRNSNFDIGFLNWANVNPKLGQPWKILVIDCLGYNIFRCNILLRGSFALAKEVLTVTFTVNFTAQFGVISQRLLRVENYSRPRP